jgi:hypothetical protein
MLDCKRNRLDYGELLRPPSGYHLDHAIAATYSADLGTLLSIPVALVHAQTLEGDFSEARFQLLEAIKQFSSRVKVYHQKGQLHKPAKLNWLYAYLEDALAPILPADAFTAFHPKLWVIRYAPTENSGEDRPNCFRVIVLSRNLTFDRSWDVAACIDGELTGSPVKANQPLVGFVQWLDSQNSTPWASEFINELKRVKFTAPDPFSKIVFHPIGTPDSRPNPTTSRKAKTGLVVSPFLHPDALAWLRENTGELFLFSNREELERMPDGALDHIASHHLSDLVVDGEFFEGTSDGKFEPVQQKLHAKLFIFDEEGGAAWFLGSANATTAAARKNVEFMLELSGGGHATRVRPQLNTFLGKEGEPAPFVPFDPGATTKTNEEEAEQQQAIRCFEYALLCARVLGHVIPAANGSGLDFTLSLDLKMVPNNPGIKATAQPFNVNAGHKPVKLQAGQIQTCTFENISEVELSRFILFRLEPAGGQPHEFLVRIEIEGLPTDRLDNILRKIIDSRDKFFDYLRFLLAEEIHKEDLLEVGSPAPGLQGNENHDWHAKLPIMEQLLITASRSPKKLRDINDLIHHLGAQAAPGAGPSVIPPDFIAFWEAFRSLIPQKPEGSL